MICSNMRLGLFIGSYLCVAQTMLLRMCHCRLRKTSFSSEPQPSSPAKKFVPAKVLQRAANKATVTKAFQRNMLAKVKTDALGYASEQKSTTVVCFCARSVRTQACDVRRLFDSDLSRCTFPSSYRAWKRRWSRPCWRATRRC